MTETARRLASVLSQLGQTKVFGNLVQENRWGNLKPTGLLAEAARKLGETDRFAVGSVEPKHPMNAAVIDAGYIAMNMAIRYVWLKEPLTQAELELVDRLYDEL